MIRYHGIENITPRIRKFAADFPGKAAQAMRDAADTVVVDRIRNELATQQRSPNGNINLYPANWKGDLSNSVRARTTRKSASGVAQKYASIIIEYGPVNSTVSSKGYWKRFEAGGIHGDWTKKRIAKWEMEKFKIPKERAYALAAMFIKNYLEQVGANQYPIMETAWGSSKEQFIMEWRANLRATFSKGSSDSIPF